jgi:hypothetical protein
MSQESKDQSVKSAAIQFYVDQLLSKEVTLSASQIENFSVQADTIFNAPGDQKSKLEKLHASAQLLLEMNINHTKNTVEPQSRTMTPDFHPITQKPQTIDPQLQQSQQILDKALKEILAINEESEDSSAPYKREDKSEGMYEVARKRTKMLKKCITKLETTQSLGEIQEIKTFLDGEIIGASQNKTLDLHNKAAIRKMLPIIEKTTIALNQVFFPVRTHKPKTPK